MAGGTIRIGNDARRMLRELASRSGEPMQRVLEKAIEHYRRQRMFDEADAAYLALRSDPEAWREEIEERRLWEVTLTDGLELDEQWPEHA
jgi:predicted transcriptional regulator